MGISDYKQTCLRLRLFSSSKIYKTTFRHKERKMKAAELHFWFKYDLGQEYYAPQVRPNQGQNSYHNVHIMTVPFHVTETPTLTTQPSVTSYFPFMLPDVHCSHMTPKRCSDKGSLPFVIFSMPDHDKIWTPLSAQFDSITIRRLSNQQWQHLSTCKIQYTIMKPFLQPPTVKLWWK